MQVKDIRVDVAPFGQRYEPGHPAANAEGFVLTPNVKSLIEMMDLREAQRGYNQSRLLAAEVARHINRPLDCDVLIRIRDTPPQTSLPRAQRLANVRGSFRALRKLSGARLLLVDDVTTTGATIEAATRALRRRGAVWVGALALARTPEERSDVPPNPPDLHL